MSDDYAIRSLIRDALAGDIESFLKLTNIDADALFGAPSSQIFTLRSAGVARVLRQLRAGRIDTNQAQAWASFARRGYFPSRGQSRYWPLEIAYESQCEATIADAVARLDELDDVIDGKISDDEATKILLALDACESG